MLKVFVATCEENQKDKRGDLASVLSRAGMDVVPAENLPYPENLNQLNAADCSIHIVFPEFSQQTINGQLISLAKVQFEEARKKAQSNPDFKIIIWMHPETDTASADSRQTEFINEIRNNLLRNMIFSNAASAIQLTDDLRSMMEKKEEVVFNVNATDIFIISNELDDGEAEGIIDMLSDIVPVEKLSIVQDSDMDYSEFCSQQIGKSKLAVIYFKESGDWAVPFAQQVWKKIGGASSHTPILLIGDEDPDTNMNRKLKAPKVISLIVAGELIPLEIKVQFDKVVETL